jgi:hypothetical protein
LFVPSSWTVKCLDSSRFVDATGRRILLCQIIKVDFLQSPIFRRYSDIPSDASRIQDTCQDMSLRIVLRQTNFEAYQGRQSSLLRLLIFFQLRGLSLTANSKFSICINEEALVHTDSLDQFY